MTVTYKQPLSRPQSKAPRVRLEFPVSDFDGVDNSNDPSTLTANKSPDSLNTILDSVGSIETRKGYTKLLTTKIPVASNNGFAFYKSDGTKQLIYRAGTLLYKYDNAGGSTAISSALASSTADDFDVYQDILYGVDGTEFYQYNGISTASLVVPTGVFTAPQYLRVSKNRVWIAQGSNLYFSDAGQPTSFPIGNFINVNSNDGQVITGLAVLLDSIVVFKTDSIWVITGEPLGNGTNTVIGNLNLRRANSDVGCIAYRTIKQVENVLFFMARSGLYVFENYAAKLISGDINNTFQSDMSINNQNLSWALYSPVQKKYILGYASSASNTPDKAIVYDMLVHHFTIWDHFPGAWSSNFRFQPLDSAVMGDPTTGNVYNLFSGYSDIAGYNGTLTTATGGTITDSTAAWTVNQFVDCRVQVGLGSGTVITGTITSNTATVLTVSGMSATPSINQPYTIGGYNSYWKTAIFDFDAPQMSKRYKYLNVFVDAQANYSLQVGVSIDFSILGYNLTPLSLASGATLWDQVGITWDQAGITYDLVASLFKRAGLPGKGRYIQFIFGNFNGNQPFRVFSYSVSYKLKRAMAQ